jgi:integrase/recombinase XerD
VHLVAQLSRWLTAGLDVAGLTELEAGRFVAARRARVRRLFRSRRALDPLITYLTLSEVLASSVAAQAGPAAEMVERYRRYLLVERGLTQGTAHVYVEAVRPLVASFATDARVELERMRAADVSAFVLAEANRRQGTSIRSVATALRSLLQAGGGAGRRVADRRGVGC